MNQMQDFAFNEAKATQVAAHLLERAGGQKDYLATVKLLYMVDREAIRSWGVPIAGGAYFSLSHGPITSPILDLSNTKLESTVWQHSIERVGDELILRNNPGDSELSPAEVDLIDFVFERWGNYSAAALRHLTHTFGEWEDPAGGRLPITPESIMRAVGHSDAAIEEFSSEIQEMQNIRGALER